MVSGLVKAAVFGFLVALMGCYQGYHSKGGAQGVGAATTKAVVSASILILTANYVVTELFFSRMTEPARRPKIRDPRPLQALRRQAGAGRRRPRRRRRASRWS